MDIDYHFSNKEMIKHDNKIYDEGFNDAVEKFRLLLVQTWMHYGKLNPQYINIVAGEVRKINQIGKE